MFSLFKKSKKSQKSKKSKKSPKTTNLYYHVKVELKLMPQTELDLTAKEFYGHLLRYIDPDNIKLVFLDYNIRNIRLLNKTLYFDVLKEGNTKKEIQRRIKMTSLADGAWETLGTDFWKIVRGDQELFLVDINKVDVN